MVSQSTELIVVSRPFLNGWELSAAGEPNDGYGRGKLELNVIFTDPQGTLSALKISGELARDLRGRIRLLAPQVVPLDFALTAPPVSIAFTERLLLELVSQGIQGPVETTVHLYLCRDRLDTLGQVLKPNSTVVIGGKRWWPTDASWIARMLRFIGHQVIFVPNRLSDMKMKQQTQTECGSHART